MTTTRAGRDSAALLAGSAVNGLAAFAFIAVGTRSLGADGFAPVAVLWAFWALSTATLTFPIQHWVIRHVAISGSTSGIGHRLVRVGWWVGAVAVAESLVAGAFRDDFFGSTSWWWPVAVGLLALQSGYLGVLRGVLAGRGRYVAAASVIGGESLVRLAIAVVLAVSGADASSFGGALVAGIAVGLLFPSAHRLSGEAPAGLPGVGLLGATGVAVLGGQIVLNGGPIVLPLIGAAEADVTRLFAALALGRAPYLLALGLSVRATAPLAVRFEAGDRPWLRVRVLRTVTATVAFAALALPIGGWLGPPVIGLLFGSETEPTASVAALVAAGAVLALGSLALTVFLIATANVRPLVAAWGLAVIGGAVAVGVDWWTPIERTAAAFAVAEAVAVFGSALPLWRVLR